MLSGFQNRGSSSGSVSKSAGIPASGFLPTLGAIPSAAGVQISQGTAIGVSTVYACVMQRARDFARCTPRILSLEDGRSGDKNTDHYLAKILRRPNWVQTWFEFALQMHVALLLRNNAYAVILRRPDGTPQYLIPVNPDNVMVLEASDGQVFYNVNRQGLFQMAALRDHPVSIPEEDVLHLRGLAFNMLVGVSTIGIARDAIGLAMGLEQQSSRFMQNGARPSGVLQSKGKLNKDSAERLRDQWDSMRSGIQNAGRTAVLEEGTEWKPMQMTSVDLEFMEQRKFQSEDIARFMNMPLWKIGITGELGKTKIEDAQQEYVDSVIMPDIELWEQKLEMHFDLDAAGLQADFDERNLLRASETIRINNQRLKVMSGLATPNECRAEEGLKPMEGGDKLFFPVNTAALGSNVTGTAADGAGRPENGTLADPGNGSKDGKTL
nr:phage portal protein [Agrobacterium vitis]